jgi:hypothetical protein
MHHKLAGLYIYIYIQGPIICRPREMVTFCLLKAACNGGLDLSLAETNWQGYWAAGPCGCPLQHEPARSSHTLTHTPPCIGISKISICILSKSHLNAIPDNRMHQENLKSRKKRARSRWLGVGIESSSWSWSCSLLLPASQPSFIVAS